MSWIDHIVERQIADAIARDELVPEHLKGADLDLDTQRNDGWWAEQFVRKERSRLLHDESLPQRDAYFPRFWRCASLQELTALITEANRWVVSVNQQLLRSDALMLFDVPETIAAWRSLRPA